MRVAVPTETRPGERRVALVPDAVGAAARRPVSMSSCSRAPAARAFVPDAAYREAGADVVDADVLADADVVTTVAPLSLDQARQLRHGAITIGFLPVGAEPDLVGAAAREAGARLLDGGGAAHLARAVDGRAVLAGARRRIPAPRSSRPSGCRKFFPLFMTAAGTVAPAAVLVLGAGVAGLQAIATARRLGAVVQAYDVRSASADEVRSIGATFVDLGLEALEGAGGYAREMAEERATRQRELLTPYVAAADAVITHGGRARPARRRCW